MAFQTSDVCVHKTVFSLFPLKTLNCEQITAQLERTTADFTCVRSRESSRQPSRKAMVSPFTDKDGPVCGDHRAGKGQALTPRHRRGTPEGLWSLGEKKRGVPVHVPVLCGLEGTGRADWTRPVKHVHRRAPGVSCNLVVPPAQRAKAL